MKKVVFISAGVIILAIAVTLLVKFFPTSSADDDSEDGFIKKESVDDDVPETIEDFIDSKKGIPEKYVERGEECKAIDETVGRGDCFERVNDSYLIWSLDLGRQDFFYPTVGGDSSWYDILYYDIEDDDDLSSLHKTNNYDHYEESEIERGEKMLKGDWYIFSNMVPRDFREDLNKIYWTDTGDIEYFSIGNITDNPEKLYISFSHLGEKYEPYYKYTMLHEFGHVLTLNKSQSEKDMDIFSEDYADISEADLQDIADNCDTYFTTGAGCLKEDSYFYQYIEEFWEDLWDDYEEIDWNDDESYSDFFYDHEDQFFNSYQGHDPTEDIADSFAQFVMRDSEDVKDKSDIKYEKLQFFYEYDELTELRTDILENIYDLSVKDKVRY